MRVLVVDIGGTNVKILATGEKTPRKFPSGPKLTPRKMVAGVKELAGDWKYDAVAIGYPGIVKNDRITAEPHNLGRPMGRVRFQGRVRAPGPRHQRRGHAGPRELQGRTAAVSRARDRPRRRAGGRWRRDPHGARAPLIQERHVPGLRRPPRPATARPEEVAEARGVRDVARLIQALMPDDVVIGGGNTKKLTKLPAGLPARRQRQCVHRRLPPVENVSGRGPAARSRSRRARAV